MENIEAGAERAGTGRAAARHHRQGHGLVARRGRGARLHRAHAAAVPRSPMGKGVMPDDHPLSVGAARSLALQNADVVFLMGARFNWIMHFGLPPRFNKNVQGHPARHRAGGDRPEQADRGGAGRRRQGDRRAAQQGARQAPVVLSEGHAVAAGDRQEVGRERGADRGRRSTTTRRRPTTTARCATSPPGCRENAIIIGEGASTMDIGRTQLPTSTPRSCLDAGSYGTMGVGMGLAIAACVVHPDRPII